MHPVGFWHTPIPSCAPFARRWVTRGAATLLAQELAPHADAVELRQPLVAGGRAPHNGRMSERTLPQNAGAVVVRKKQQRQSVGFACARGVGGARRARARRMPSPLSSFWRRSAAARVRRRRRRRRCGTSAPARGEVMPTLSFPRAAQTAGGFQNSGLMRGFLATPTSPDAVRASSPDLINRAVPCELA
eukprot:gene13322-biopygen480